MALFENQQGMYTKIQEFTNRTRKILNYSCGYIFCEEKQEVGLFAYHLEGLRVPQFGKHCFR